MVLVLYWCYTGAGTVLVLQWYCTGTVLVLHEYCAGRVTLLIPYWCCTGTGLVLYCSCTRNVLALYWHCAAAAVAAALVQYWPNIVLYWYWTVTGLALGRHWIGTALVAQS